MYRTLRPELILTSAETLSRRIAERFPGSGLSKISQELLRFASESEDRLERLRRPHWPARIAVAAGMLLILVIAITAAPIVRVAGHVSGLSELLQGLEAAINDVVFLGIAVFFLLTIEGRIKRRRALRAIHELRSIAHIIDMHQVSKDPEHLLSPLKATSSSRQRTMTRFELARYLVYCSELLAITSKLAALYVQDLNDPVVLDAVDNVQDLTHGLSAEIWQKIMMLDTVTTQDGSRTSKEVP